MKADNHNYIQWDSRVFDWAIENDHEVIVKNSKMMVDSWLSLAVKAYNTNQGFADMSIEEYLAKVSGH